MILKHDTPTSSKSAGSKWPANQSWMNDFGDSDDFEKTPAKTEVEKPAGEFAELFEASQQTNEVKEGQVLDGIVLKMGPEWVTIDIGFKCEGLVPTHEFKDPTGAIAVKVADVIPVYVERLDLENGTVYLSRDRAEIFRAMDEISHACDNDQIVEGTVVAKGRAGLTVDIGVKAFLPIAHIDHKPVKSLDRYMGQKLKFKIIKFDKQRGSIVLSRKAVLSHEKEVARAEMLGTLREGQEVTGTVKNLTDYGAFVDLGGIDGLLHLTDMSWGKLKHPNEVLKVGDQITVKILKYDREKERVSLGLKQMQADPWDAVDMRFPVGKVVKGKIVSLKDYGAFVELEEGIEGLIHVSEMSWTERVKHPSKVVNVGDVVDCKILEVEPKQKRISLGIKQLQENPWDALEQKHPVGSIIEGDVKSVTDFGLFLDIGMGIDGLIHVSDISWNKKFNHPSEKFKKGEKVKAVVIGIDKQNEKFSLGIKQLERDPWENIKARYRVGQAVDGAVTKLTDFGAFIELEEGIEGLIYISELSDQRVEKPGDIVKIGDKVRAEIMSIEPRERRIALSIKKLVQSEERANYEAYAGDRAKKTSMGDVLGDKLKAALKKD